MSKFTLLTNTGLYVLSPQRNINVFSSSVNTFVTKSKMSCCANKFQNMCTPLILNCYFCLKDSHMQAVFKYLSKRVSNIISFL